MIIWIYDKHGEKQKPVEILEIIREIKKGKHKGKYLARARFYKGGKITEKNVIVKIKNKN